MRWLRRLVLTLLGLGALAAGGLALGAVLFSEEPRPRHVAAIHAHSQGALWVSLDGGAVAHVYLDDRLVGAIRGHDAAIAEVVIGDAAGETFFVSRDVAGQYRRTVLSKLRQTPTVESPHLEPIRQALWAPYGAPASAWASARMDAIALAMLPPAPTSFAARLTAAPQGQALKECDACPALAAIPPGAFTMGSPADEPERVRDEGPQRSVQVAAFAMGVAEVSFAEWDACVDDGGCDGYRADDEGWGRGDRPVINVSWEDAQAYVAWLNRKAGASVYRLPSEAEWEYAARGGTTTPFWWGMSITPDQANYNGERTYSGGGAKGVDREQTVPVRSFEANPFGLYQVHGNVYEWAADCWNDTYSGAPSDGSAWMSGDCSSAVLRGGSWNYFPWILRSANRGWDRRDFRYDFIGFRVARTLADD